MWSQAGAGLGLLLPSFQVLCAGVSRQNRVKLNQGQAMIRKSPPRGLTHDHGYESCAPELGWPMQHTDGKTWSRSDMESRTQGSQAALFQVSTVEVSAGRASGEGGLGSSPGGASLREAAPGPFGDAAGSHAR